MSWSKRRGLSRRAFLGGGAVTLALPFLPSLARAGGAETRLLFWYVPNGLVMPDWTPTGEGPGSRRSSRNTGGHIGWGSWV